LLRRRNRRTSGCYSGAAMSVLDRGTALSKFRGLVAIEYSADVDARTRCRAHQAVDGFLKSRQAVDRAFEDRPVERGKNGDDVPGYPRAQLRTEQARRPAVFGGAVRRCRRPVRLTSKSRAA
jgi:hypothetical protein